MSIIKVLQYPDPRLRQKAAKVEIVDETIQEAITTMFETHYAQQNCAALAATQLDFTHPMAITVIDYSPNKDEPLCLINPRIIAEEGIQYEPEGCMSVYPQYIHEKVKRAYKITVQALNEQGKEIIFEAEGFMAKCIQHEIDHLHGKLFIDRLPSMKRLRLEKKLEKLRRQLKKR